MKGREILEKSIYLENIKGKKLPVQLSLAIAANLKELAKWSETLEEQRIEIITRYADKDEEGKPIQVRQSDGREVFKLSDEAMTEFSKDYAEMLGVDVDGIQITTVPASVLEKVDDPKYDALTVQEVESMTFMIA